MRIRTLKPASNYKKVLTKWPKAYTADNKFSPKSKYKPSYRSKSNRWLKSNLGSYKSNNTLDLESQ